MQLAEHIRDWYASQIVGGGPIEVPGIKMSPRKSPVPHRRRSTGTTPPW
jgi:hypothetical protein